MPSTMDGRCRRACRTRARIVTRQSPNPCTSKRRPLSRLSHQTPRGPHERRLGAGTTLAARWHHRDSFDVDLTPSDTANLGSLRLWLDDAMKQLGGRSQLLRRLVEDRLVRRRGLGSPYADHRKPQWIPYSLAILRSERIRKGQKMAGRDGNGWQSEAPPRYCGTLRVRPPAVREPDADRAQMRKGCGDPQTGRESCGST